MVDTVQGLGEPAGRLLRVGVIDDHDFIRRGVLSLVDEHGIELGSSERTVAGFLSAEIRAAATSTVVIVDVDLRDHTNFLTNLDTLRRAGYQELVVLTTVYQRDPLRAALKLGVVSLVAKNDADTQMRDVLLGLRDDTSADLITPFMAQVIVGSGVELAGRQQEVLAMVSEGHTHAQVGRFLGIEVTTVRSYLQKARLNYAEHYPELAYDESGSIKTFDEPQLRRLLAKDGILPYSNLRPDED